MIEIVDTLCAILERIVPAADNEAMKQAGVKNYGDLKKFVADRAGHDRRYAIDATRIKSELGWKPSHDFDSGMQATVRWYVDNREWCRAVQQDAAYGRERLGRT